MLKAKAGFLEFNNLWLWRYQISSDTVSFSIVLSGTLPVIGHFQCSVKHLVAMVATHLRSTLLIPPNFPVLLAFLSNTL